MKLYKTKKGFTLMDVLITTAIISLLSSVTLFQVTEAKKKANDSHMKVEAQQISNAIALYKNDNNGRAPLSVISVRSRVYTETEDEYKESMQLLVSGGYISEIPTSPDGQSYTYVADENNNAVFAFKLKQESVSGNRKNSCPADIEVSGGEKVFMFCKFLPPTSNCTESPGFECFDINDHSTLMTHCGCSGNTVVTSNSSIVPLEMCHIVMGGTSCPSSIYPLANPYRCTYTLSATPDTPTCDGSSTSDYCQCA